QADLKEKLQEWSAKKLPYITRDQVDAYEGVPHILMDVTKKGEILSYRLYQPHVHNMLTMRDIDPTAENGFGLKNRSWNDWSNATDWRQKWANIGADALAADGMTLEAERYRAGHMTLEGQRQAAIDRG